MKIGRTAKRRKSFRKTARAGLIGFLRDRAGDAGSELVAVAAVLVVIGAGLSFTFHGVGDQALRHMFGPLSHKLANNADNVQTFFRAEKPTLLK